MNTFRVTHRDPLGNGTPQKYCGPAALSALTGYTAECCGAWINHFRFRPAHYQNRGTHFWELEQTGRALGIEFYKAWIADEGGWTLNRFRKEMAGGGSLTDLWGKPMLVQLTGHWIAVFQGMVVDSGFAANNDPIPLRDYRKSRTRVHRAWFAERESPLLKREPLPSPRLS